ncbi:MAG: hypothetical protein BWY95_01361 [Bacteroidetes bacterium ADurb.BinA104]|nr:MAG: hypothetical protein BWY95_01361 [Bacteroidetes bacterium ADurb.BinA104]
MPVVAVMTTNNAYDTVLVDNSGKAVLLVDKETFGAFAHEPGTWEDWQGEKHWAEDDIFMAAKNYGDIIACYNHEGALSILDRNKWEERKWFYE